MVAPFQNPVRRVPRNETGRDFVVGDIHGCFDLVLRGMDKVGFDQSCDRIISVGDLIDRGPGSHRAARFLSQPWVHAVRGNHEDTLLEIYAEGEPDEAVLRYMGSRNGFRWWLGAPDSVRADILEAVARMPLAMEVDTPRGSVGVVHADVPFGLSWPAFLARLEAGDEEVAHEAMWGRDRIYGGDESGVAGIGRVFVGHTPLPRIAKLGNLYAIDTGAVFGLQEPAKGVLTFAEVTSMTLDLTALSRDDTPEELVQALAAVREARVPFSGP